MKSKTGHLLLGILIYTSTAISCQFSNTLKTDKDDRDLVVLNEILLGSNSIFSFVLTLDDNPGKGLTEDIHGIVGDGTVELYVPSGTDTTGLIPTITTSLGSITPGTGEPHDFPDGIGQIYTLTSMYMTTRDWLVTLHVMPKAGQPSIAPNGGTFAASQTATITCATPGATIMYTTDGSDPRTSPTRTAGSSVFVSMPMTIRAYAYAPGYTDSDEAASAAFTIISGIVFVSTAGDDANQGTILFPKRTIPAGITLADTHFALGEVRVAMGTYDSGADMTVPDGISLYGAYSGNFSSRDLALNDTVIYNTRTTGASNILLYNAITSDTVIDGFIIRSAPSAGGTVISIYATNCNNKLIIRNNTIRQTTGAGSSGLIGIYCLTSSPYIYNNVIFGGSSTGRTTCIYARNGSNAYVYNNTLVAGTGTSSHYVFMLRYDAVAVCHLTLANNLLVDPTANSTGTPGLYHMDAGTGNTPVCYTTNLFYTNPATAGNGEYIYYASTNPNNINSSNYTTLAAITSANGNQLLTYVNPNWSNIVNVDPQFNNLASENYRLQATSPAIGAGTNLSGTFTTDRDGKARPGAGTWTIGAYE